MRQYDVVIVGGGPAGLNAALVLGRARRRVLLCDSGEPRNAPAEGAHNFLTQDGVPPLQLLQTGHDQLQPYASVEVEAVKVEDATRRDTQFELVLAGGERIRSRKVILATGVRDELPSIPGFRELWGTSIAHCPYCHGWEVRDQPLATVGNGEFGFELTRLLRGWSRDLVLCTDGIATLSGTQREALASNGIPICEQEIASLESENGHLEAIVFANGERLPRHAIFMRPPQHQHSDLAERLGCSFTSIGLVQVDAVGRTEIPGLYVAGDAAQQMQALATAASSGMVAGSMVNHELAAEDFG